MDEDQVKQDLRSHADALDKLKPSMPQGEHATELDKATEGLRGIADDIEQAQKSRGIVTWEILPPRWGWHNPEWVATVAVEPLIDHAKESEEGRKALAEFDRRRG